MTHYALGNLNGHWRGGERRSLDDAPFQFTNLEWMQIKLDIAHNMIFRATFPAMVERGKAMIAEVVRDVTAELARELAGS